MKEYNGLLILCAVFFLVAVLDWLALAEMKKVDEVELARTNASVTGAAVKDQGASGEKGALRRETVQASVTFDKGADFFSPSARVLEGLGLSLNIKGQETFQYNFGAYNTNMTGGITSVKYYEGRRP